MSELVLGVEWKSALARPRDFALYVSAPLVLVLIVATGGVPPAARAACYTALFTACGALSTALPVWRDGERGMVARIVRGGISPASYLLQRAAAGATLSLVLLLPAVLVALAFLGATAEESLLVTGALVLALWTVSVLGVLAAAVSRSRAELAAFSVVGLLLLLHMSGVFHTPEPGGYGLLLEDLSPFRLLHEAFSAPVTGTRPGGLPAAAVWALAPMVVVVAGAPTLTRALRP